MSLHNLTPAPGSIRKPTRIGRGEGSGKGGTSTKGHKGAQSRTGYSKKFGFEGGQMPLQRRVPKRGFKNPFHKEYEDLNLDFLQFLSEQDGNLKDVDLNYLVERGVIANTKKLVKVLGRGELSAKLTVSADAFSKSAKEAIEKAGGSVVVLGRGIKKGSEATPNADEASAGSDAASEPNAS